MKTFSISQVSLTTPFGELTSLPAQEAERVTSLALKKLLENLTRTQSNLAADVFLKELQDVMRLSIRKLTETVVLYKDRLEVTLSKDITERLKLNGPACCAYPIEPRSVGKRHKIILSDALQHTPNQELILCVARSWKWYWDLTKGRVKSLQELAKNEQVSVETITRNLPLASLKPDQVERLLKGQHTPDLSVAKLIKNPALL